MPGFWFGPQPRTIVDDYFGETLRFRSFGYDTSSELTLSANSKLRDLEQLIEDFGKPDLIYLWLAYQQIPEAIFKLPIPIVGLAPDWNLQWHHYKKHFGLCDLIISDKPGVAIFKKDNVQHALSGNLFGLPRSMRDHAWQKIPRDIDVLFVGNLNPCVQSERMSWLGEIARLSKNWNVVIRTGVFGEEYRRLLNRARIVFNHSIRGECNKRVFEAIASGALLFQEEENWEVQEFLIPEKDYVEYNSENLEQKIRYYLEHPKEISEIVENAQSKLDRFNFPKLWKDIEFKIDDNRSLLDDRMEFRLKNENSIMRRDSPLEVMATKFRRSELAGSIPVPQLIELQNRIAALKSNGRDRFDREMPGPYDYFKVEWERTGWSNAGDVEREFAAKKNLLLSRISEGLAKSTGKLYFFYEAVNFKQEMIHTRAALGCALAREGHILAASNYLSQAVKANPFDRQASRAYTQTLQDIQAFRKKNRFLLLQQALHKSAPQVVPQEHWFEGMILSGDELTSIIILCCNEAAYTRRCFESLLLHTRSPYELIVIDNGSTDETEFLLQEYSEKFGADRWLMIRNEHNLGFPKGVNQALKVAHGEYVVLLNNDTIVTADWLEALIDWQISAPDQIGLVGPVSNGTRAPQLVIPDYNSLVGISPFAALRKAEYQGHCLETERLTGFCLLGRKTLFDHLGGLDENFGTGFFEDDDLCVRTRKLGLKLLVALDVYIHHEGSCTFKGLKLDTKRLLNENFALFQKKWGDAESAGYRSQSPKAHSQSPSSRIEKDKKRSVSISLTMMVKNEEANLEDCLLSVRDLVDEMIVVDTGSHDRTREIAQRLGAKVYDFPWVDSFAAARNEGLKHATGDWVFWMDADDRVDEANRQKLKELFDSLDSTMAAYVLKCLCVSDGPGGAETVVDHVRLFRRDPRLLWRFRVHEQILPDLRSLNAEIRWSDATIRHVGYKDPALRKSKLGRDRRLLELEIAENPSNPFTLFNLGSIHQELGEHQIALDLFRRSLAGSHPSDSIVRKLYALIVQAHRKLGQNDEAFYAVKAGLQVYPQDSELIFLHAMMLREQGDIRGAEACFKDLINTRESNHFASVDTGLRGYKARHNLAILYMEQGRFGDAQEQWQQVLESEPTFLPALAGFAEIAARLNNKAIFESYLQRMSQLGPTGEIEAESLWVRYYMNLNEFSRVRDRLFKLIEKYPQSVLLRTHLTHALLREGKDPQVAQKALLDLLELDPNNAEAKHNLLVLETVGFKSA